MITAEQVLYDLHMQLHPNGECKRAFCAHRGIAARLAPLVHDMIKEACAEAAQDTRERLVAAAARAIQREPSTQAITTVEQLQAHADRAAIHGPNAAPAVVLDSQGVPWLICINEDGDTFAQTMPDGPDTPSQHDFEQLLEHNPTGVTPLWPAPGGC